MFTNEWEDLKKWLLSRDYKYRITDDGKYYIELDLLFEEMDRLHVRYR